jgi:hypothetical protein
MSYVDYYNKKFHQMNQMNSFGNYMASFFFLVEFKYIKKIIHISRCIRKYFYLILNSTRKKKLPYREKNDFS